MSQAEDEAAAAAAVAQAKHVLRLSEDALRVTRRHAPSEKERARLDAVTNAAALHDAQVRLDLAKTRRDRAARDHDRASEIVKQIEGELKELTGK
jgi:hypothetical protein